jgi:hypothetical protein
LPTRDKSCRDLSWDKLSGIEPKKIDAKSPHGTTLVMSHTPLLIFVNEPESLLWFSCTLIRDCSCPMLSGIGPTTEERERENFDATYTRDITGNVPRTFQLVEK